MVFHLGFYRLKIVGLRLVCFAVWARICGLEICGIEICMHRGYGLLVLWTYSVKFEVYRLEIVRLKFVALWCVSLVFVALGCVNVLLERSYKRSL